MLGCPAGDTDEYYSGPVSRIDYRRRFCAYHYDPGRRVGRNLPVIPGEPAFRSLPGRLYVAAANMIVIIAFFVQETWIPVTDF